MESMKAICIGKEEDMNEYVLVDQINIGRVGKIFHAHLLEKMKISTSEQLYYTVSTKNINTRTIQYYKKKS